MLKRLWLLVSWCWVIGWLIFAKNETLDTLTSVNFLLTLAFPFALGLAVFYSVRFVRFGTLRKPRVILYR